MIEIVKKNNVRRNLLMIENIKEVYNKISKFLNEEEKIILIIQ